MVEPPSERKAKMGDYKELEAWRLAMDLVEAVYKLTTS